MLYTAEAARSQMVRQQVRCWDVLDPTVLAVLEAVPREDFVPAAYQRVAYADAAIPLGHGQYMLKPIVEGRLLQALELQPHERVLEIGSGSGYLTACLARLAAHVTSLEIEPELAASARRQLAGLGIGNAEVLTADAFATPAQPYDAVAVTGSLPLYRGEFDACLRPGGRMFLVEGTAPLMKAWLYRRAPAGELQREWRFETSVPPLRNAPLPGRFRF